MCYTLNNSLMCSVHTEASAVFNKEFSANVKNCAALSIQGAV